MSHLIVYSFMAKGSFLGVKRGKLGDAVGYNVTNSNNKDTQGWRVYQPVVSNPQTDGQIDQRVKLAAANNLYRALKPIIQRGWQNHKYGDESRRAFLQRAMGSSFEGPYIEKGSTLAVPIKNVPIMYGSLEPIVGIADGVDGYFVLANVPAVWTTQSNQRTVGEVSVAFVDAGIAQEGDQVTFVIGSLTEIGQVAYKVYSFFVNTADSTIMIDAYGLAFDSGVYDGDEVAMLSLPDMSGINTAAFAAVCSISRDGDNANLRSYAEFAMSDAFENYFYGNADTKKAAAKASYKKKTSSNTNWEQVPGGESGGGGSTVTAFTLSGTEIVPGSLTNVAAEPAEIVDANGQRYFVRAHTSAGGTRYLYGQGGGDFTSSATAPTGATNANTIDPCAANNIASGCRAWLLAKGVSADLLVTT